MPDPPVLASAGADAAAATYKVVDLGVLAGGVNSSGEAINANGDVVGWSETAAGIHPVMWRGSRMRDLGLPFGTDAYATGISDDRTVVGYAAKGLAERRAFVWKQGVFTLVAVRSRDIAFNAINNGGVVVGGYRFAGTSSAVHALRWTAAGGVVDLHPAGYAASGAFGISENGTVAGWARLANGTRATHAAQWSPANVFTDLGTLSPGSNSWANDVNDAGRVVAVDDGGGQGLLSFVWCCSTQVKKLGTGAANGISPLGRIVGIQDGTANPNGSLRAATRRNAGAPWQLLPQLGAAGKRTSFGFAVNACGTMAGWSEVGSGAAPLPYHAVRWAISTCDK